LPPAARAVSPMGYGKRVIENFTRVNDNGVIKPGNAADYLDETG
jgi:hypothetical protein